MKAKKKEAECDRETINIVTAIVLAFLGLRVLSTLELAVKSLAIEPKLNFSIKGRKEKLHNIVHSGQSRTYHCGERSKRCYKDVSSRCLSKCN